MAPSLTSALLALALAQATASPPRTVDGGAPPAAEAQDTLAPPALFSPTDDERAPEGVPFMPTVGPPPRTTEGLFLDLAFLSQVRARTLATSDASTVWGTDVEATPGIALALRTSTVDLAIGYAPRLTVPFDTGAFELAVLNRATFQGSWRVVPTWIVSGVGVFLVGDYSQLIPASTPGGPGPPPPVVNPVRSFQTYPYVGIDTLARVDGLLSPRTRIRLGAGYFDVGGVGEVGQTNQPRSWGPQAEAELAWDASRRTTFTTSVKARDSIMNGNLQTLLATVTEAWRQAWTTELETTLAAGPGIANRDIESQTAAGHVVPVAILRLEYRERVRRPLHVGVEAALAPYFDPYLSIPYQRFTIGGTIDWRPGDAWQVGGSVTAVLVPYTVRAPESYVTTGLSGSFAPVPFLILTAGGFNQVQFQGATTGGGDFRQWTAYFSVALQDRIAF